MGNSVTYSYSQDVPPNSDFNIDSITYNGTTIRFYRQLRNDNSTYTVGDQLITVSSLLTAIVVSTGGSTVRAYHLDYTPANPPSDYRSLLTAVTEFGDDAVVSSTGTITSGTALPSQTINWTSTAAQIGLGYNFDSQVSGQNIFHGDGLAPDRYSSFSMADVNGDGRADTCMRLSTGVQCWLSTGTGWQQSPGFDSTTSSAGAVFPDDGPEQYNIFDYKSFRIVDVNADGKADVCARNLCGMQCWISNGTQFTLPAGYDSCGTGQQIFNNNSGIVAGTIRYGDVDGDGFVDVCGQVNSSYQCWLSTGQGWAASSAFTFDLTQHYELDATTMQLSDNNGDGRADLCLTSTSGQIAECFNSSTTGWNTISVETVFSNTFNSDNQGSTQFADVNGDGMADVCARLDGGEKCILSSGVGNYNPVTAPGYDSTTSGLAINANSAAGAWAGAYSSTQFTDLNGDGRLDLCYLASTGLTCYLSTGSGWIADNIGETAVFANNSFEFGFGNFDADNLGTFHFADVNGDGIADACIRQDYGVSCWLAVAKPAMVSAISNGMGGRSTINYVPSSAYTNTYLPQGMVLQTVGAVTTSEGRSKTSTVSNSYGQALWSNDEQTFLGFGYVKSVIDGAGDYTETLYHQHDGCIAKPDWTYVRSPLGLTLTSSNMRYTESATAPWTSLMTTRFDNACQGYMCRGTETTLSYDQYANILQTVEYGNIAESGDERTTNVRYGYNQAAYLSVLASQDTYAGIGGGTLLKSTRNVYDGNTSYLQAPIQGVLTRRQHWDSNTGGTDDTGYTVDSFGNVISTTDPLGNTSTTSFDSAYHLFPVSQCDALHHCTSTQWNYSFGLPSSTTDVNGISVTYSYDALGRKTILQAQDGNYTQWQYISLGSPTSQHIRETHPDGSADGLWSDSYRDGLGRAYKVVTKKQVDEAITTVESDSIYSDTSTRVWKRSLPYVPGQTPVYSQFSYDGLGRLTTVVNPDGTSSSTTYGIENVSNNGATYPMGWIQTTDELGHGRKSYLDAYNNTVKVVEYLANGTQSFATLFSVDMLSRTTMVIDAANNASTTVWDSLDRKRQQCDSDLGCRTYSYDAVGHLLSSNDANGNLIGFAYDAVGRPAAKSLPGGKSVNWYYDESGHGASQGMLTSVIYSGGQEAYVYDNYGRPSATVRCVMGVCETIKTGYDAYDRVASLTYPDCDTVIYHFDEGGHQSAADGVAQISYDALGHIDSVANANGTVQSFSYDPNRAWLTSSSVTAGGATLYQAAYSYDAAARVRQIASTTDAALSQSFVYDDLNRLTSVSGGVNQAYQYDLLGNITSKSNVGAYSYGDPAHKHAATQAGSALYSYDANGNMLSGPGKSLAWDGENRVSSVTDNGLTTSFDYDPTGSRIRKGGTYYFGGLVERSETGGLIKYISLDGRLVARRDGTGTYWFHADHVGSPRLMTNQTGAKIASYAYAPFGETLSSSSTVDNSIGFDGQRSDSESGLVYMNARYYDPVLARFTSADTIVPDTVNPQAYNRYSFVYNNPVSNTDPSGHLPVAAALIAATYVACTSTAAVVGAVAIAGALFTTAGYFMHDGLVSTVGSVLAGIDGSSAISSIVGVSVGAVTSPLSPLSPGVKEAIGWAWSAYRVGSAFKDLLSPGAVADQQTFDTKGYQDSVKGYPLHARFINDPLEGNDGPDVGAGGDAPAPVVQKRFTDVDFTMDFRKPLVIDEMDLTVPMAYACYPSGFDTAGFTRDFQYGWFSGEDATKALVGLRAVHGVGEWLLKVGAPVAGPTLAQVTPMLVQQVFVSLVGFSVGWTVGRVFDSAVQNVNYSCTATGLLSETPNF